jgi:gamma-aminobutyric acid type B receptor
MESFIQETTVGEESVAIISVGGWPMRNATVWMDLIDQHPSIITICADTLPHQMDLMNRGYVTGLVGQVPFQMGANSIDTLLAYRNNEVVPAKILGTSLQEVMTVPLNLPPVDLKTNQIGNLMYVGLVALSISAILAVGAGYWTWHFRKHWVVRASQPIFLEMIAAGVLIMCISIIPMSADDGNFLSTTGDAQLLGTAVCMSQVWLLSVGFTTIFAALFSKTWRINKIFHNPNRFQKMSVAPRDVVAPLAILLTVNVMVLVTFTIRSPLEFIRKDHDGMDAWNRVISSYGTCHSGNNNNAWPYLGLLVLINTSALLFALIQAYQARSIQSEFSESQYIAIVMASFLQIFVIGVPLLFLVQTQPVELYVLKVAIVFLVSVVVLVCIFVPKMWHVHGRTKASREGSTPISLQLQRTTPYQIEVHSSARHPPSVVNVSETATDMAQSGQQQTLDMGGNQNISSACERERVYL